MAGGLGKVLGTGTSQPAATSPLPTRQPSNASGLPGGRVRGKGSKSRGLGTGLEGAEALPTAARGPPGKEAAGWAARSPRSSSGQRGGRISTPAGGRSAALRAALPREGAGKGVRGPRAGPRRPGPLPSTLVRVRTGLLQALSGATRAECFFMMSRPPAGAPPRIAYILGPAGARLAGRVASPEEERERLAAPALPPRLPARFPSPRDSLRRPPGGAHGPRQRNHCTQRAHSLPLRGCCKLQRHVQVHSPLPPSGLTCSAPAPGRPAPQPGFLPGRPVPVASGQSSSPAAEATRAREGRPREKVLAVHKFKQGCLLGQNPEVLLYRKSQKKGLH